MMVLTRLMCATLVLWCQGVTPSNYKGGLPAPEAGAHTQEGGIEAELTQPLAGQRAHKTKQKIR